MHLAGDLFRPVLVPPEQASSGPGDEYDPGGQPDSIPQQDASSGLLAGDVACDVYRLPDGEQQPERQRNDQGWAAAPGDPARNTRPILPLPSSPSIWYLPTFVGSPGSSGFTQELLSAG